MGIPSRVPSVPSLIQCCRVYFKSTFLETAILVLSALCLPGFFFGRGSGVTVGWTKRAEAGDIR